MQLRRQNERSWNEIDMEEIRDRQCPTSPFGKQWRKFEDGDKISDSSSTRSKCSHGQIFKMNYIKVDIPDFKGKITLDEFMDWHQTVECIFEYNEISGEKKVKILLSI